VVDDPVHHGIVGEKGDDALLAAALGTEQGVHFIDFSYTWVMKSSGLRKSSGISMGSTRRTLAGL